MSKQTTSTSISSSLSSSASSTSSVSGKGLSEGVSDMKRTMATATPSSSSSSRNSVKVSNIQQDKNTLSFQIENANVSIVNALRRVILSDIPTVTIRTAPYEKNDATFYKNTTRLHNEILKQRLSSIPIHITDHTIPFDDFVVEIKQKNDTDVIQYITTKDFKIKNIKTDSYLQQREVAKIFPPNEYTKDFILFARLRPKITDDVQGEELHIEAKMSIATAKEDSMFNVVSTCAYSMTPDPVKQKEQWKTEEKKLKDKGISDADIEYEKENWYLLDGKRFYKHDTFDFIIKTLGVYDNGTILQKALQHLLDLVRDFKTSVESQTLDIQRADVAMVAFDIIVEDDDYTLGKMLEYALHQKFYRESMVFDFVGFRKEHPHDKNSKLRVSFANNSTNKEDVYRFLSESCEYLYSKLTSIQSQMP